MPSIPPTPPAPHADGTPHSIQLFTIAETGLGPYVGLPVTDLWLDDTPHLFTRETAAQAAADVARDDLRLSYTFAADGTLTLQWTDDFDALGRVVMVVPDAHGRYLLGGMWPWTVWDRAAPHTAGQAAYALGAAEYRHSVTTAFPDGLSQRYDQGREEAHRVTLRCYEP
ncbi:MULTISPECIES: hypothetical protein [unclassified Streptomyces]|uniref:hypothetical protein n=1 Tax=unclassified Streptomyces TaxID=2593676 RepID=UPI0004C90B8D|nr:MULTISPECIES: hypothetical protein [unclassified Streptomyces]KOV73374.1 hypothetical protein ADL02_40070 [Streptomyces sp. NRRL WC-3723]